ncbi:hypothetical protein EYZ11_001654 [Aspergillus tanneri]|nr:hypothetical protein EYZ11_001654 [Aspergillus tanneri]
MLSIALRIAQALCLHMAKPPFPVRPFESEMRRRLWSAIGFLDIQASTGCASEPMMQAAWLQSHPPSNINDHDINFEMGTLAPESEGFTDMTFTMIVLKAQYVFRLLNFSDFTEPTVKPIHLRQQLVVDFQHTASTLLHHIQADTIPFHWFTRQVAQYINASMQLITLRPLLRNPNYIPPRVHGDRLLRLAVDVLEKHQELRNNPRAFPWRWSEYMFMPWHALAVAASELSVCEDPVLMERFWTSVEQAQERLTSMVEDKSKDMFWKPMENIMAQAQARRNELLDLSSVGTRPLFSKSTPSDIVVSPMSPQSGHIQSMSRVSHNGVATGNMAPAAASSSSSSETIGLGSWSSVWDAVDFGNHLRENELSWLNYENFIDDLNSIIMPR